MAPETYHDGNAGLEWKPYTSQDPQAMVYDTVSKSVALRDDKLVSLLPAPAPAGAAPAAHARGGAVPVVR